MASGVDEDNFNQSDPLQLVKSLSKAKTREVVRKIWIEEPSGIGEQVSEVLGCDSVFEFGGNIFGKPRDKKEAIDRWVLMEGKTGYLHTGHTLHKRSKFIQRGGIESFDENINCSVVTTKVYFVEMRVKEINDYVATGEPLQCSGGFALEGIGAQYIKRIEGCYSNVIGLSLPWLRYAMTL